MPTRTIRLLAVLAALSLPLLGCIGVQSNAAREFDPYPPSGLATSAPTPIALTVTYTAQGVPANEEIRRSQDVKIRTRAAELLDETGAVRVAHNAAEARYRLSIKVDDQGGGGGATAAAILTGLTLYVIPSWITHHYTTLCELTGPDGNVIATKRHVHALTMIQELFMVFGMPTSSVGKAHDRMWDAVLKDVSVWTAEQIQRSGA